MVRADLTADAAALLRPEWLAAQRWFGARDRTVAGTRLADAAPLRVAVPDAPEAWLLVAEVTFADGGTTRYLVPAVADGGTDPLREPRDGEGAWRALLEAVLSGATLPATAGSFRCDALGSLEALVDGDVARLAEHRLGVQQSNTSVTLGDALILKLYRRLEPGENPELEVGAFLESVACPVTPRMAGSIRYLAEDGGIAAAALVQERIATDGDAWDGMLARLAAPDGEAAALEEVATIGRVTGTLHASLAARPLDLAFPVRAATPAEVDGWVDGGERELEAAMAALDGAQRERLVARAAGVRAQLRVAVGSAAHGAVRVMRIHGDYHLGQLLHRGNGYVVVDFEGEPARPLAERRAPQPAERDLAGMLRSFDYAARTVDRRDHPAGFDPTGWVTAARDAFLAGYAESAPSVPDPALLRAFEIAKACYEVRYEAANRPDWTWLPLDALDRLV